MPSPERKRLQSTGRWAHQRIYRGQGQGFSKNKKNTRTIERSSPPGPLDQWCDPRATNEYRSVNTPSASEIVSQHPVGISQMLENLSRKSFLGVYSNRAEESGGCLEGPSCPTSSLTQIWSVEPELEPRARDVEGQGLPLGEFTGLDSPEYPMNWRPSKKYIRTFFF